ncbi:MAG: 23S rRNA (guanosine(2251)-2'-O)-methyltransferase RlmB [Nitrospinae bacterium RIFCSPLOWO2_12_FULL_47_7]|nr:MAG: 23S rRNA (guanosine(2251)-2'-O)-methyltransferase RlmB [Nitrospinae bacterium RIFCSPLOWO2_12_FULL_47_7]
MQEKESFICGVNPVHEALKASKRRCYKIVLEEGKAHSRIRAILDFARPQGVRVETLPQPVFQQKYHSCSHQGIVAYFSDKATLPLPDLIQQAFLSDPQPTLALLDEIQDPHNMGAIIRSAEVLGVQGIVIPKHRSAPLNETVAKCSAGAMEMMSIACVTNLAQAIEEMKQAGFWIVGVDMEGEKKCHQFDFNMPVALVIGGEEKGVRPTLKKACDFTVSIPMRGTIGSLNASTASAVVFYEILRQKDLKNKKRPETPGS